MIYILVTIRDRKVAAFQPLHCVRAEGEAIRNFQDAVNDPNNRQLNNHADDFELYRVGTLDDQNGEITAEAPKMLANGSQMKINQGITITR